MYILFLNLSFAEANILNTLFCTLIPPPINTMSCYHSILAHRELMRSFLHSHNTLWVHVASSPVPRDYFQEGAGKEMEEGEKDRSRGEIFPSSFFHSL